MVLQKTDFSNCLKICSKKPNFSIVLTKYRHILQARSEGKKLTGGWGHFPDYPSKTYSICPVLFQSLSQNITLKCCQKRNFNPFLPKKSITTTLLIQYFLHIVKINPIWFSKKQIFPTVVSSYTTKTLLFHLLSPIIVLKVCRRRDFNPFLPKKTIAKQTICPSYCRQVEKKKSQKIWLPADNLYNLKNSQIILLVPRILLYQKKKHKKSQLLSNIIFVFFYLDLQKLYLQSLHLCLSQSLSSAKKKKTKNKSHFFFVG